jgi:hypothetical protein
MDERDDECVEILGVCNGVKILSCVVFKVGIANVVS